MLKYNQHCKDKTLTLVHVQDDRHWLCLKDLKSAHKWENRFTGGKILTALSVYLYSCSRCPYSVNIHWHSLPLTYPHHCHITQNFDTFIAAHMSIRHVALEWL